MMLSILLAPLILSTLTSGYAAYAAPATSLAPPTSTDLPPAPGSDGSGGDDAGFGASDVCSPEFDAFPASIANSAVRWGLRDGQTDGQAIMANAGAFEKALFVFKKVANTQEYTFTAFNNTNLNVGLEDDGDLVWKVGDANNENQRFVIECSSGCTAPAQVTADDGFIADGCTIRSAATGQCVQVGDGPEAGDDGDAVSLRECDDSDSQRYNIIKSVSAGTNGKSGPTGAGTGAGGAGSLKGAIEDDDDDDGRSKALLRNSYILMGLLGGAIVGIIALVVIVLGRGGLKGKPAPAAAAKVTYAPVQGAERYEIDSFTHPAEGSKRYSDA